MKDKFLLSADDDGAAPPSVDEQITREQLAKLKAEVRGLTRWSFDTLAKLMIGVLAILAAAWAFYIGLPKAQIDLYRAMDEVANQRKQIADNDSKLAAQAVVIQQQTEQMVNRNDALQRTQTALGVCPSNA